MTDQVACPRCQIGNLQATTGTYTSIQNGMLLSVPNMPVWKCDVCQYQEFDYDAITRVEALVGHLGLPDDPERRASTLPTFDSDVPENNHSHRVKP